MLATLLAGFAATAPHPPRPGSTPPDHAAAQNNRIGRTGQVPDSGEALIRQLESMLHRPTQADDGTLLDRSLNHHSWRVVRGALNVLKARAQPIPAEHLLTLLGRALRERPHAPPLDPPDYWENQAREDVLNLCMEELPQPLTNRQVVAVRRVMRHGANGSSRARAMQLLALQPPADWQQLVTDALRDPSERVRLQALTSIAGQNWEAVVPAIEPLASDARPAVRYRALETLKQLGHPTHPTDYGLAVLLAARAITNRLEQAGFRERDVLWETGEDEYSLSQSDRLARLVEEYLDWSPDPSSAAGDGRGVLLLALTVRAGREKLTRRLWEMEITRSDTDEGLAARGLEAIACTRLIRGLAAYRSGSEEWSLEELASIARLRRASAHNWRLQRYVAHAGLLSDSIWAGMVAGFQGASSARARPGRVEPAAVAAAVLADLKMPDALQSPEARSRLEAWCGLAPRQSAHRSPSNRMAN